MLPTKFHVPWVDIDPSLQHGGIPGELEDQFVGPQLGDNTHTVNLDMLNVFSAARDVAAAISMMPSADTEGAPIKNAVDEVLKGTHYVSDKILDRVTPSSNKLFEWTHATPPAHGFTVRPVRFPLRNAFVNQATFMLIGQMVEIAENNANGQHSRISPNQAAPMLAPLWHMRAMIMRDYFDLEVGGEVSTDELAAMFAPQGPVPEPVNIPQGESAQAPEQSTVLTALDGIDVLRWFPTDAQWQVFAQKMEKQYAPERIYQPEGAMRTSEDVAPHDPVQPPADSSPAGQP